MRRSGDEYQDLIAWGAALRVIQPTSDVTQLEIEIKGVGNVDDVVLRHRNRGDRFGQVKWATRTAFTVDETFMTERTGQAKSLLQKLYASYQELRDPVRPPVLELLTNRGLDATHPLLGHVDGRTDLLVPYAADALPASAAGKQLEQWATHVGCDRGRLLEMLTHLVFRTGLTVSSERDRAQVLMLAAGLRHGDDALRRGIDAAAAWVRGGRRIILPSDVQHVVDQLALQASDPRAVLLVQAIDRDPHPEDATESVNWVDLYEGDTAATRCRPWNDADWQTMADELAQATHRLETAGWRDILIRGALRQATFFLVGTQLPAVRGTTLSYIQSRQLWSTDTARISVPAPERRHITTGAGTDLAIAVGVAMDPAEGVVNFTRAAALPVGDVVILTPGEGAHDQVIRGPGEAVAYAQLIRDSVRAELERHPASERVHLFLAGPGGLALLLGHRWNRIRPTTVYEHLGPGRGYAPAFNIDA
ncbi:SAVED domain-containing protein [Streptomyces bacillaris]|uniref:SAVED domain-containing protein n=1 Tax=Streptomyces bacillaris TaxID=68179 RepID=UPI0035DEEA5A